MKGFARHWLWVPFLLAAAGSAQADSYSDTAALFNNAGDQKGMVVFTIAKGGLMYAAAIAGQKFSYTPRAQH